MFCRNQNLPQEFWSNILAKGPDLFIWTGDSIYAASNRLNGITDAYSYLLSNKQYQEFRNNIKIDGVWDDHGIWCFNRNYNGHNRLFSDYGVNDAGRHIADKKLRQRAFLSFLGIQDSVLSEQDGLYHFSDITLNDEKVRFIYLDTRSHRDPHWIRSVGGVTDTYFIVYSIKIFTTISPFYWHILCQRS